MTKQGLVRILPTGVFFIFLGLLSAMAPHAAANSTFSLQTGATCDTCHIAGLDANKTTLNDVGQRFLDCRYDAACAGIAVHPAPRRLPAGSYASSCHDMHVVDNVLEATCRRADQSERATSLPDAYKCSGGIDNADGKLVCGSMQADRSTFGSGQANWGAIAVDDRRGERASDVIYGTGSGQSRGEAQSVAMRRCESDGRSRCSIAMAFHDTCGAYAASKKHAGNGSGRSQNDASQAALDQCGSGKCRVVVASCAGEP